ncbi:unnamed protein product [Polarella glacialis]|uniref:NAD(P)-binding domain-containing protein n=1 Tax=Polarella glacialis TaxID=89957 RepID=A0A813F7S5_POLGL|nr:unnamed protein product [Polarella glacialis]
MDERRRRSPSLVLLLATGCVLALRGLRHAPPGAYIAVFGATGLTGREAVYQALQRGLEVRVLARNPSKLLSPLGSAGTEADQLMSDPKLTVIQGDVTKLEDVEEVLKSGVTGVVVALGGKTADVGETMLTDGTSNIIAAMKRIDAKRVAVVTSIGAGDSENQAPFFFKVLMYTMMNKIFKDKNNQEALFLNGIGSELEYTIVRPGGLTVEAPTGVINVIDGEAGSIARGDVADFCLGAILEPDFAYIRKTPCISSVGGTGWIKDRSAKSRMGA